jgi:hypothetical protein
MGRAYCCPCKAVSGQLSALWPFHPHRFWVMRVRQRATLSATSITYGGWALPTSIAGTGQPTAVNPLGANGRLAQTSLGSVVTAKVPTVPQPRPSHEGHRWRGYDPGWRN